MLNLQYSINRMNDRRKKQPLDHLSADLDSLVENGLVKTIRQITDSFGLDGQFADSKDLTRHCANKKFDSIPFWVQGVRLLLHNTDMYISVRSSESKIDKRIVPNSQAFINHCRMLGNLFQQRDDYPAMVEKFLAEIKAMGAITKDFGGAELLADLTYIYVISQGNQNINHCQYNTINPQTMYR